MMRVTKSILQLLVLALSFIAVISCSSQKNKEYEGSPDKKSICLNALIDAPTRIEKENATDNSTPNSSLKSAEITEQDICKKIIKKEKKSALDSTQQVIGKNYVEFTHKLDNFLSNNTVESKVNRSYLLLTTQSTNFKEQDNENDISINAKLDLANTKERYQIFFDSILDEQQTVEEKASSVSSGTSVKSEQSTAGLEYRKKTEENQWRMGIKAGVTTSYPFHPFLRYRMTKEWQIFAKSQLEIKQDFWYLDGTGWGETTQFDIETQLTPNSYILFSTDIEFEQEDIPLTYSQFVSLYSNLSEKNAINYRIGALGSNNHLNLIDSYLANIHFIHRLRGDWMFISVIPEVTLRRERDWDDEPSITLKLDFFFK